MKIQDRNKEEKQMEKVYIQTLKDKFEEIIQGKEVYCQPERLDELENYFKENVLEITTANNNIGYMIKLKPSNIDKIFV